MEYAKFTPLPKTDEEIIEEQAKHKTRQDNIQKFVDDNNLIKLKCDYFGMDSYYYDTNYKTMYKVCNIITMSDKSTIPKFEVSYDSHILEINNITKKITFAEKKNNIWNPRFQTGKLYIQNKNP